MILLFINRDKILCLACVTDGVESLQAISTGQLTSLSQAELTDCCGNYYMSHGGYNCVTDIGLSTQNVFPCFKFQVFIS